MITVEDLGAALDQVSPVDLQGCITTRDERGAVWFMHPDWQSVFCKIGQTKRGRWLILWGWVDEHGITTPDHAAAVIVLTMRDATSRELDLLTEITR